MNARQLENAEGTTLFRRETTFVSPAKKLLEKTKQWEQETRFRQLEVSFFIKIIMQSHALAHGAKKEQLHLLQKQFSYFRNTDLEGCRHAIQVHTELLAAHYNCKYPPADYDNLYDWHRDFEQRLEELDAVLKGLKLKAFEAIEEFLTVRIF